MSIHKAVSLGITGNTLSKQITGTSEVSAGRTALATGSGAALGAVAAGGLVIGGLATAPLTVPLAVAAGTVSFIASLFD